MTEIDFQEIGRRAYLAGEPSAPWLSAAVRAAVGNMAVGTGTVAIFHAYRTGWLTGLLAAPVFDELDAMTWNDPLPPGYAWRAVNPVSGEHHLYAPDGRDITELATAARLRQLEQLQAECDQL